VADKLGDRIRKLREQSPKYKSLRQFADALKKSPSWVSKVERNLEVPSQESIVEIARLLDADSDELLTLANKLDPEIERDLVRHAEMHGLLRTIKDMTPAQLERLGQEAKRLAKQ
jgi:HTH-type transcriptional regulator, competence development regulator